MHLRLRLDVDIGGLGIELSSMPNQPSIGIRLQYQSHCLDVDKIGRWNQSSWGIPIHVWMSTPWYLILSTPREAGEEPHGSPAEEQRGTRRGGGQGRGAPPPSTPMAPAALHPSLPLQSCSPSSSVAREGGAGGGPHGGAPRPCSPGAGPERRPRHAAGRRLPGARGGGSTRRTGGPHAGARGPVSRRAVRGGGSARRRRGGGSAAASLLARAAPPCLFSAGARA